jgi:hypothetical protein
MIDSAQRLEKKLNAMSIPSLNNGFTRGAPSPRYKMLLSYYQDMHKNGDTSMNTPPEETFEGRSLFKQIGNVQYFIEMHKAKTILDYGSGKGSLYDKTDIKHPSGKIFPNIAAFWKIDSVKCYDPAHTPFSDFPVNETFDGVISTDVMEHCPEEDLPWIIQEMFSSAEKFVFANIACHPAERVLPNGENAHCTVHPPEWWRDLYQSIATTHPGTHFHLAADVATKQADGTYKMEEFYFHG